MRDKDSQEKKKLGEMQEELLMPFQIVHVFKQLAGNKQNYMRKHFIHLHQAPFLHWVAH